MRAIAILLVLVAHAGLEHIVPGGFGVTIFFFLSGFLITSLLRAEAEKTGRVSLRDFYLKRAVRILPPLYITLVFCLAMKASGLLPTPLSGGGVVTDLLFLTNYSALLQPGPGFPVPLWSLDVEEHFYLLFPLVFILVLKGRSERFAALFCLSFCALILAIRLLSAATAADLSNNYYFSHTRIDSIVFGCWLALWNNPLIESEKRWTPRWSHFLGALAVILLCLLVRSPLFRETLRYSLQGLALFVIFSFVLQRRGLLAQALSSMPLRLVALWSYTLYLIHFPMFLIVRHALPTLPPLLSSSAAIAASVAFAIAMRIAVEKPLLAKRDAYLRRRRTTGAVSDQSAPMPVPNH